MHAGVVGRGVERLFQAHRIRQAVVPGRVARRIGQPVFQVAAGRHSVGVLHVHGRFDLAALIRAHPVHGDPVDAVVPGLAAGQD